MLKILSLLLIFATLAVQACPDEASCVEENSWQLGVAIGLGARSNPLVDGDSVPLVVMPDIAWYGEKAYFDNGELGYQWVETPAYAIETYLTLDRERAFFSFWHPVNVFAPNAGFASDSLLASAEEASQRVSIDQIASRKWAVNAGMRLHWFTASGEWTISVESDVSDVHQGQKAILAYTHKGQAGSWRWSIRPAVIWKSENLTDYYYGLDGRDEIIGQQFYHAEGGIQPAISVAATRKISQDWQWIMRASYQYLHTGMRDSPLVEENAIRSLFIGVGYRF